MRRTFQKIRSESSQRDNNASVWSQYRAEYGISWKALLESPRVLLVSEAGAGKTFECQLQAERLFEDGHPAFFTRLEHVAATGIKATLYGAHLERFEQWLGSSLQKAYFFLDSIDELELAHLNFRDALSRLAHDLDGALGRASIIVTSRPIAIDRRAFEDILPVPQPIARKPDGKDFVDLQVGASADKVDSSRLSIVEVELLPFSNSDILEFAAHRKVKKPELLLAAIDAKHAGDFARRPQDLIELCEDWNNHGRIRAHFEQVKNHVEVRLVARTDRKEKAELPLDKALEGAQRLALGCILGKQMTIRYSVHSDLEGSGDIPLDPRKLLQDWGINEIAALLGRAIFVEGGYGRLRVHHRSVLEYLAARKINQLIDTGVISFSSARRIVFSLTATNSLVIKPSLRPVAGWLALLRSDFFDTVLNIEPVTLLAYGDPESLTDGQRNRALRAFVQRYGKGQWRGLEITSLQVSRFAHCALSETVKAVWSDGIENPEVRELLLDLIATGELPDCADLAANAASDATGNARERSTALRALIKLNDARVPNLIESAIRLRDGWTSGIMQQITMAHYPLHVSDAQLLHVLRSLQPDKRQGDRLCSSIASTVRFGELDLERMLEMLPEMTQMTWDSLHAADDERVVVRSGRISIFKVLHALCVRLLSVGQASATVVEASVLALQASSTQSDMRESNNDLRRLLRGLPQSQRRSIFEADYACMSRLNAHRMAQFIYAHIVFDGALQYSPDLDWEWVLQALSEHALEIELRSILLKLAVYLTARDSEETTKYDRIRNAVIDSAQLREALAHELDLTKPSQQVLSMQEEQRKREARRRQQEENLRADWKSFWSDLAERHALALAPGRVNLTLQNLTTALEKVNQGQEQLRWDRQYLTRAFGAEATEAIRKAFLKYWRTLNILLRSERAPNERNSYPMVWSTGLVGVYAEADDASWAQRLTRADAELATRYAFVELNGFPHWIAALAEAHPSTVESIIGGQVEFELSEGRQASLIEELAGDEFDPEQEPESGQWHSMSLQNLRYGPKQVAQLLTPRLVRWLDGPGRALMESTYTATGELKVEHVVRVLLLSDDANELEHLENFAAEQVLPPVRSNYLLFWVPVLCALNAERGIQALLNILDSLPVEKDGLAVHAIGGLFHERRSKGVAQWRDGLEPDSLLRLMIAIQRHVRIEDDLRHEGVYSPGYRDAAEDGRRYIFDALMAATGPKAMQAKLALSHEPLFAHLRDRITTIAQERLSMELDAHVIEANELAKLFKGSEISPKTGTDMAQLLIDRLDDLQDLMLRDASPRAAWAFVDDENSLRPAIARELDIASRWAYTIDQEAVTVDGKETDIRLRSTSGYQATIELKIGEKDRSAKDLQDTIEEQLVEKYMAAANARTGCLLVTVADPKKRWRHPKTNKYIDLHGLQLLLNQAAQAAQEKLGGDARVLARVLDLIPRLQTEAGSAPKAPKPPPRATVSAKNSTKSRASK